ncbi:MAG: LamG-like jellyroll fold domain-containing protein [Planctomycetota bacterium]|jgi:tetratricopeptide (TPR) repeat protein
MKVQYGIITILVAALIMSPAINTAEAKLLAYWKLDEMRGTTTSDSISSNDGIFQGSPSWKVGKIKGAIEFGGMFGYVLIENESEFDITYEITVSTWVKPEYDANRVLPGIVTKGRESAWALQKARRTKCASFYLNGVGIPRDGLEGKIDIFDGKWHHIAGVYDGSKAYLYIDGSEDISTVASGAIGTNDTPVCIGYNAEDEEGFWCGFIDDVAIFDHALNADEVSQLYAKGIASFIDPTLLKLIDAVQKAKAIINRQQSQRAVVFLEEEIAEYKQWKEKNSNAVKQPHRMRSSDLYFLLAKAKEAAGVPKKEVAEAYKSVIELNVTSSPNYTSALLWLYENRNTEEYKDIVYSLIEEQQPQKAVVFLEKEIAEYKQWKEKKPNDIKHSHRMQFSDLSFLLAKAKEAAGVPKKEVTEAYKNVIDLNVPSSPNHISALLWLYENRNAEEYKDIVCSFLQNNNDYLQVVATQAELMIGEENLKTAIKYLEDNLAAYAYCRERHPYYEVVTEERLPEVFFHLAKAKELAGDSKESIADAYSKTFSPSHIGDVQKQTSALIWLLENEQADKYKEFIRSFTQSNNVKDYIKDIVSTVCKYFESRNDWSKYEQFLDTLFAEATFDSEWVVFVESCLNDKTNKWAKGYSDYIEGRPRLKFNRDCFAAEKYATDGKFEEAAELYKSLSERCVPSIDKAIFDYRFCECLFNDGKHQNAISELEQFIIRNKTTHRSLVVKAMILKGQIYIQTGDLDKAIDTYFTLMMEYPEIKKLPEINFFVGYCYTLKGDFEAATETFNYLLKDYPNSLYADKSQIYITRIKSMTD